MIKYRPAIVEVGAYFRGSLKADLLRNTHWKLLFPLLEDLVKKNLNLLQLREGAEVGTLRTGKASIPAEHLTNDLPGA